MNRMKVEDVRENLATVQGSLIWVGKRVRKLQGRLTSCTDSERIENIGEIIHWEKERKKLPTIIEILKIEILEMGKDVIEETTQCPEQF